MSDDVIGGEMSREVDYYRARLAAWIEAHEALEVRLRERDERIAALNATSEATTGTSEAPTALAKPMRFAAPTVAREDWCA